MSKIQCPSCLHDFEPPAKKSAKEEDLDIRATAVGVAIVLIGLSCWWWDSSGWSAAQVFLGALGLLFGVASFMGMGRWS